MRIQHNITAMNSYRNFTTNNSSLSKNLEKLSSGYKINRAGDDAAGLAISEKMRAQITGIEGASKNAKDGISLIQTAEGALTEVHSMLNRMTTLAEQSANGTYDNDVDRTQLQKEVESLKSEIDRIADSTNYNGIKLLDGSLAVSGVDANLSTNVDAVKTKATANTYTANAALAASAASNAADGAKMKYTVAWKDENGEEFSKTVSLTMRLGKSLNSELDTKDYNDTEIYLQANDGSVYTTSNGLTATKTLQKGDLEKALKSELDKDENLTKSFDVKFATDKLQFTAKTNGTGGATIMAQQITQQNASGTTKQIFTTTAGADGVPAYTTYNGKDVEQKLDLSRVTVLKGAGTSADTYTPDALKNSVFEVDGKKFVMAGKSATAAGLANLEKALERDGYKDVTVINLQGGTTTTGNDDGKTVKYSVNAKESALISTALSRALGEEYTAVPDTAAANLYKDNNVGVDGNGIKADPDAAIGTIYYKGAKELSNVSSKHDGKLELQIGDTAEQFNKMSVNVADMHTNALGIDEIDISTQDGASEAMAKIKAAINSVSDTRGGLGALQNRLDHTINNLGVMRENIQNAESLIRDTDVAEEMMTYTKNSILNQSAQAMLAQANQLPQGVLQLLG